MRSILLVVLMVMFLPLGVACKNINLSKAFSLAACTANCLENLAESPGAAELSTAPCVFSGPSTPERRLKEAICVALMRYRAERGNIRK